MSVNFGAAVSDAGEEPVDALVAEAGVLVAVSSGVGEEYARFRRELSRIIHERAAWSHDAAEDKTVVPMCGGKSAEVCPIKSFYYRTDVPFMKAIQ